MRDPLRGLFHSLIYLVVSLSITNRRTDKSGIDPTWELYGQMPSSETGARVLGAERARKRKRGNTHALRTLRADSRRVGMISANK